MIERVLTFPEALAEVLAHAHGLTAPREVEVVPLKEVLGRVLGQPVRAERDQPPFDRATRDGFAVRSADFADGRRDFQITGSVRAGEMWQGGPLVEGQAMEIMTGAPVPAGADAVIMLEHVAYADNTIHIDEERALHPRENIVPRGAEAHVDEALLPVGRVLGAAEIAVAANCGCAQLAVFHKPKVAIVATGDELVELDRQPEPWQVRNSNSHTLAALVHGEGGIGGRLVIARDTLEDLRERILQGREWDLMLVSGGVSMGKYDLVEQALRELGAEFYFTGVLIQPGKPLVFGRLPKGSKSVSQQVGESAELQEWTYFFGLPGNPVSTQVCFHLFVAPLLRSLAGRSEIEPRFAEAKLAADVKGGARVTRFLPAEMSGGWDGVQVRLVGWQGSGDVAANARGNCYAVLPMGTEAYHAGETVRILLR